MAQTLAVLDGVPVAALNNRHDVISLGFALVHADTAAGLALPRIPCEHGLTPRSMPLVAVALCRSVWPGRRITTRAGRLQPQRLMGGDALWHG